MENRQIAKEMVEFIFTANKYMRSQSSNKDVQGISDQKFRTLVQLEKLEKCTLKELSKQTCVSSSSLCIMLNRFAEEQLVERETDSRDRRNTFYSLSEQGRELLSLEREKKLAQLGDKIDRLCEDKKVRLVEALKELGEILEELK